VDEGGDRQPLVGLINLALLQTVGALAAAAAAEVNRQRLRPLLEDQRRHVLPHQPSDLTAVGGDQRRLIATAVRQRCRAEKPIGKDPRQRCSWNMDAGRNQGEHRQREDEHQPDPLDRPLPSL
jgi:hypothetical protein